MLCLKAAFRKLFIVIFTYCICSTLLLLLYVSFLTPPRFSDSVLSPTLSWILYPYRFCSGAWGGVVVKTLRALLVGRSRDRFPVVSLGIFSVATDRTMCLGSSQPLKMSTRDFWVKGCRCLRLTTYHPSSRKSGSVTYPEPLGPPRPVVGDLYLLSLLFCPVNT